MFRLYDVKNLRLLIVGLIEVRTKDKRTIGQKNKGQ